MPTPTQVNVYMYLLRMSNKYIEEAIKNYDNKRSSREPNHHEIYYKINYHMFTFTQLIYTVKERLKKEHPTDKKEIERFFNNSTNLSAAVKQIANDLKHNGKDLIHTTSIKIQINKKNSSRKITEIKTDRHVFSSDLRVKNKNLSKLFKETYNELENFLNSKSYVY